MKLTNFDGGLGWSVPTLINNDICHQSGQILTTMMTNIFADKSSFLPQYQCQTTHSFIALPLCALISKLANQIVTLLPIVVKYVK